MLKIGGGYDREWSGLSFALDIVVSAAHAGEDKLKPSNNVVGTWRLLAASPTSPLQAGFITYTSDGRVSAILRHGGRKPLSSGDRISASVEERAEAYATLFAYAGSYDVVGDKVIHHVEIASVENWVNTDMIRLLRFDDDKITLTTTPLSVGGKIQTTELVWERVKS